MSYFEGNSPVPHYGVRKTLVTPVSGYVNYSDLGSAKNSNSVLGGEYRDNHLVQIAAGFSWQLRSVAGIREEMEQSLFTDSRRAGFRICSSLELQETGFRTKQISTGCY